MGRERQCFVCHDRWVSGYNELDSVCGSFQKEGD